MLSSMLGDETPQVAAGSRWFAWYGEQQTCEPQAPFCALLAEYTPGAMRGPLNEKARLAAGFSQYELDQLQSDKNP